MKLTISEDLSLPIEAVTEVLGFLGRRGQGKSYAAQKLAELFHKAGAQFVALDPVGIWWGLRLSADGKAPGIPIPVFGGLHGDVPLEPGAGKMVADVIIDRGISTVLDVSQFESDADKARFATDFGARFYFRRKQAPAAVHLFLEECQEFVPQNPQKEETRMLHVYQRIAKLGRNYGIGVSLISQRPQEVHKKVLNLTELLFAFQLTGPHERKAVAGWIQEKGIDEDIDAELPKLKIAHPHAWSPAWLSISRVVAIGQKWTFDASSTPAVGKAEAAKELAPIDLEKLRKDMAATIEKAKADDPRELRKQIADLKKQQIQSIQNLDKSNPPPKTVEKFVLKDGQLAHAEAVVARIEKAAERFSEFEEDLQTTAKEIRDAIASTHAPQRDTHTPMTPRVDRQVPVSSQGRRVAPAAATSRPASLVSHDGVLPPGELAVLTAALTYPAGLDKKRLGVLTGYKRSSRDAYIARLTTKGLVESQGTLLYPTDGGRAAMNGSFEPLPTGAALVDYWRERLPEGERKTLEVLLRDGPEVQREWIDERTGYKRSSRDAYLTRLKARGLVEFSGRGTVRASDELFD